MLIDYFLMNDQLSLKAATALLLILSPNTNNILSLAFSLSNLGKKTLYVWIYL